MPLAVSIEWIAILYKPQNYFSSIFEGLFIYGLSKFGSKEKKNQRSFKRYFNLWLFYYLVGIIQVKLHGGVSKFLTF